MALLAIVHTKMINMVHIHALQYSLLIVSNLQTFAEFSRKCVKRWKDMVNSKNPGNVCRILTIVIFDSQVSVYVNGEKHKDCEHPVVKGHKKKNCY